MSTSNKSPNKAWWMAGGDIYESRWANKDNHDHPRTNSSNTPRSGGEDLKKDLDCGLGASRWAGPSIKMDLAGMHPDLDLGLGTSRWAGPSIKMDLAGMHPDRAARLRTNSAVVPRLKVKTEQSSAGEPATHDESRDVIMGENTPVEMHHPKTEFVSVLKDADGDIVMQDLDDPAVTSKLVAIVEGERMNGFRSPYLKDDAFSSGARADVVVSFVLVVDTNFMLSHLTLVNSLVNAYHTWGNIVMLPWAAVMELDGLKKSGSALVEGGQSVAFRARRANDWALTTMGNNEKGFWVQKKEEKLEIDSGKGDSSILDCARYVKEVKGHDTALLSNDKNLCLKALVYGIHTVTATGKPFSADGIMQYLEGRKRGTEAYHPPGIWSSVDEARNSVTNAVNRIEEPYYTKAPITDQARPGLFDSIHAVRALPHQRQPFTRPGTPGGGWLPTPTTPTHLGHSMPAAVPERAINLRSEPEAKSALSFLLVRVEIDIGSVIPQILHQNSLKDPVNAEVALPDPRTLKSLEAIENYMCNALVDRFTYLFPDGVNIWYRLLGNDLSRQWRMWINWTLPSTEVTEIAGMIAEPSARQLHEWIKDWCIIWKTLLQLSPDYANEYHKYVMATALWKSVSIALGAYLSGQARA